MSLSIDVIVRTQADKIRSNLLFRALDSIHNQKGVVARPIVVVNGDRYDETVFRTLQGRKDILLHYQHEASAGLARNTGRSRVTAPYFCYLDDDDYFIRDSLAAVFTWFAAQPTCDVIITNGYFVRNGKTAEEITHIADHLTSPMSSLLDENWLGPGASFFRTKSISTPFFNMSWDHHEWGYMAFYLCREYKALHFMDLPTVMYTADTPGSMSKVLAHREAESEFLRFIRDNAGADRLLRKKAERKYCNTLHILATRYMRNGKYGHAWRCHLESLRPPHTFKYLLFTRKLLWPFGQPNDTKTEESGCSIDY